MAAVGVCRERDTRFQYQPALDGLRAFAVLAVMLYHGSVLSGGFLGVDAFFVLSGFLITSLMVAEVHGTGRLDLKGFWSRRARRLLPALFLVLIGVGAYAAFVASAAQIKGLRGDGFAALFYFANWHQVFQHKSYFDMFSTPSMLQHTWSLAIEEQWYLLWPLLLPFLMRRTGGRPNRLLAVIGGMAAASAVWMAVLYRPGGDPSRVYFGTDTRAQSLLIGAGLAVLLAWRGGPRTRRATASLQLAGLAAAAFLAVVWTQVDDHAQFLYRGGLFLEALAVAVVIAAAVQPARAVLRRTLSLRPLRWIGWISYGLYLWHWPVYVFLTPQRAGLSGTPLLVVRMAVTFAVATCSYVLVETPIRRGTIGRLPVTRRVLAPAGVAVVVVALLVGTSNDFGLGARRAAAARTQDVVRVSAQTFARRATEERTVATNSTQSRPITVLFVGDSVSQAIAASFGPQDGVPNLVVESAAIPGCGIARGRIVPSSPWDWSCEQWPSTWQNAIYQYRPDVTVMLIGAREIFDRQVDGHLYQFGTQDYANYVRGELERGLGILSQYGAPVAMLSTPCYSQDNVIPWAHDIPIVNGMFQSFAAAHPDKVAWLDLESYLCPLSKWEQQLNGAPVLPDGMHPSQATGDIIWKWLGPQLTQLVNSRRQVGQDQATSGGYLYYG